MNAQLELLPAPVVRARMEDQWADEEQRSTAFIETIQAAPMCRSGVSIYMQHDLGKGWTCKRCGFKCPVPHVRR